MDAITVTTIICWVVGISCWFDLGWLGFYFWWTKRHPFTKEEFKTMLMVSYLGPLNFLIGYWINKQFDKISKV